MKKRIIFTFVMIIGTICIFGLLSELLMRLLYYNLDSKIVGVDGELSLEEVEEAIREAGYTPRRL